MKVVQPEGWARARGYANGVLASGQLLCVAGQIGWDAQQQFHSDDFIAQFVIALENVLAVVTAAGGVAENISRMTVYVTDIDAYRARAAELREPWQRLFGRHYPAMTLVAVTALVEPRAKVEIEVTAVIP